MVRSSPSLEFAGEFAGTIAGNIDAAQGPGEMAADVLLIEAEPGEADWAAYADVPIPSVWLMDLADANAVSAALRAGIRGVISRDATAEEIEAAAQAVHAGLMVAAPAAMLELLPEVSTGAQPFAEELAEPLSERELEVLDRMAEGLSNKLIAHRLGISEHTVKTHVASIFAKLGASTRTEAVSQAIRRGLVML